VAETAKQLLAAAAGEEEEGFRSGIVSVVQTFGGRAKFHPRVHALVTRGGWTGSGEWVPVPYVDEGAAEELFRHKVMGLLRRRRLPSSYPRCTRRPSQGRVSSGRDATAKGAGTHMSGSLENPGRFRLIVPGGGTASGHRSGT
jgi:hypothetical protein